MLGDRGLGHAQVAGELAHGVRTPPEPLDESAACGVGEGLDGLCISHNLYKYTLIKSECKASEEGGEMRLHELARATLAVPAWQLGRIARSHPATIRGLVATLGVGTAAVAVPCGIDSLLAPAAASSLATIALLMAWLSLR